MGPFGIRTGRDNSRAHQERPCAPSSPRHRDVHSRLSEVFRAYSVFRPVSENHLNLFDVVLLHSHRDSRSRSPRRLRANLSSVFHRLQQRHPRDSVVGNLVQQFVNEFADKKEYKNNNQNWTTATVAESSLKKAGVKIAIGPAVAAGAGAASAHASVGTLRVCESGRNEYTGDQLNTLIWGNADFVFRNLLPSIDMELGIQKGDRNLIAIVTNIITGTVAIEGASVDGHKFGAGAGDGANFNVQAGAERSGASYDSYYSQEGIVGVHFIVFPVEVLGLSNWRIYRGIDLYDAEPDLSTPESPNAKPDRFSDMRRWHTRRGELGPAWNVADVGKSGPNSAEIIEDLSAPDDASDDMDIAGTDGEFDDWSPNERSTSNLDDWVDIIGGHVRVSHVNIDLSEGRAEEFARNQCDLARRYFSLPVRTPEQDQYLVQLLRSALRKCCCDATLFALDRLSQCYMQGISVPKDSATAKKLRVCASTLREFYHARAIWCTLLFVDADFSTTEEPEKRVFELLSSLKGLVARAASNNGVELRSGWHGHSELVITPIRMLRGFDLKQQIELRHLMLHKWCSDVVIGNGDPSRLPEKIFIRLPSFIEREAFSPPPTPQEQSPCGSQAMNEPPITVPPYALNPLKPPIADLV